MEIQTLKLFITEDEANALVAELLPDLDPIEGLKLRLTPEGVLIQGIYPAMMFKTPFETLWQITPLGPEILARLVHVKIAGLPAGLFKGALLRMIRDQVAGEAGVRVEEEAIIVHLEEAARARKVPLRMNVTAVRLSIASAVVEAGMP